MYLDEKFEKFEIFRQPAVREYGRNQAGYGMKIPSWFMVKIPPSNRKYRVYITQISNAGSAWCKIGGVKYNFRDCDFNGK